MVLTSSQIKSAELKAFNSGMGMLRLMENAGSAVAREIRNSYTLKSKKIVIVCGKGNNGGDGFVIARKLSEDGASIKIVTIGTPSTDDSREMAQKSVSMGLRPISFESYEQLCLEYILGCDLIVDALFGIGFSGNAEGLYRDLINAVNNAHVPIVSVDIPSGMNCDTGASSDCFVKADMTVTFTAYKPCHVLYPTNGYCGKTVVAPIGLPEEALTGIEPCMTVVTDKDASSLLPVREKNWHKGLSGKTALFVGSKGYAGAAVIAGKAAIRSGAGIVNIIIPENIYGIVGASLPEAVCTILDGDLEEKFLYSDLKNISETMNGCNSGLIGCGLGMRAHTRQVVDYLLNMLHIPLVIDADGINALTGSIELIRQYKGDIILTPHPAEAARLLGTTAECIQYDRLGSAKELVKKTGAVVCLKGADTLVACPGGKVYVVTDGNPGMATAGCGDMLAGMAAAFMAEGMSAANAAICAVKLHALSGDTAVKSKSVLSLTPSDMIETLPLIFCRMFSMK